MQFTIPGIPTALARARYSSNSRTFYNSQEDLAKIHRAIIKKQLPWNYKQFHQQALMLYVHFHMPIPSSYTIKKQNELLNNYHRSKPDTSNLVKWVEDICNNLIYHDDCLISSISAHKVYTNEPKTVFSILPAPQQHYLFENNITDKKEYKNEKEK